MAEKIKQSELKKKQIVEAALKLFFEKGYEGTSIRMIQNKVESPVGLFYYYFESKDAVFEEAIKLLNERLQKDDVVLIKASNYMKFTEICEAIC